MKTNSKTVASKKRNRKTPLPVQRSTPKKAKQTARPVIWAVDSAQLDSSHVERMKKLFQSWGYDNDLLPATVFSPFDMGWILPAELKAKKQTLAEFGEKVQSKWKSLGIHHDSSGVLLSDSNSRREKALKLLDFAKSQKARMIIVESTDRTNSFTGMGSFTETLISLSTLPILLVGPHTKTFNPPQRLFYPTDLSRESKEVFTRLIELAKGYKAEVLLYHYFDLESGPLTYGVPWGYEVKWLDDYWETQEKAQHEEAHKWIKWAHSKGVKCEFISDRKLGGLKSRMNEAAQEAGGDATVLTIKRGPWGQVVLGALIRDTIMQSAVPVLTFHTKDQRKKLHS